MPDCPSVFENGVVRCPEHGGELAHPDPNDVIGEFRWRCPKAPTLEEERARLQATASRLGVSLAEVGCYVHALVRWAAAGFPVRDQAEVERIEQECCRPCGDYLNGRCKDCGCQVNQSGLAVANKIKMATERCPKGKW